MIDGRWYLPQNRGADRWTKSALPAQARAAAVRLTLQ